MTEKDRESWSNTLMGAAVAFGLCYGAITHGREAGRYSAESAGVKAPFVAYEFTPRQKKVLSSGLEDLLRIVSGAIAQPAFAYDPRINGVK